MKFVVIVLLLVSAVAAQQASDGRTLAEALEKRGEAMLTRTKKTLDDLRHAGQGHLAGALEHQMTMLEALVMDLKGKLAEKAMMIQMHQVHVLEEDLLALENQISDEIRIIENVKHNIQPKGETSTQLVTRGESLVKLAKDELAAHLHVREARFIEHEMHSIETLIKAIQAKPTAADLKTDEQQLARHEQTLKELLDRVHVRDPHNPHNPGHHGGH